MNKDNYKKAIDQIHASKELKEKTLENISKSNIKYKSNSPTYIKYLSACAIFLVLVSTSIIILKNNKNINNKTNNYINNTQTIAKTENNLPRFENIEQLKNVIKQNRSSSIVTSDMVKEVMDTNKETSKTEKNNYSKTNVQVENVDEADIVKTDGKYIYYVSNQKVYIVKAEELKVVSEIEVKEKNKVFYPKEIYINKNKLIILGSYNEHDSNVLQEIIGKVTEDTVHVSNKYMAKAMVYDLSNIKEPKLIREVALDGDYIESRMIEDNIYFISNKIPMYATNIKDEEILPLIQDTAVSENEKHIECTDIAYFRDTTNYSYLMIGAFNINNNTPVSTETFFGASSNVYASEKNLYITQNIYGNNNYENIKNVIYKFNLEEGQIKLQCKAEVNGNVNNQFSMNEYQGNLRIATTSSEKGNSSNQLYVLDNDLKEIGKIDNFAEGEKIYSVRFIGKVGYIVTFKQVDPLFVIDLSNPQKPIIKGELKIPGYSSYLHPYDETHIIGIGYNTKSNGYGGITNSTIKMSMFDISNLENPKEIFNTSIGNEYSFSEIIYEHKALFYNEEKNLIGFPITFRENSARDDRNGFVIYKINIENGFEKYGEIKQKIDYETNIDRAIYINNKFYTLSEKVITLYDLETMKKINQLEIE